jgi:hypothetical protein
MDAFKCYQNTLINKQNEQFKKYESIRWFNYYKHNKLANEREQLVLNAQKYAHWEFKYTKPWINSISKGCMLCGEGVWSCLFITGKCNASCFYCPTAQNIDGIPSTQHLAFVDSNMYAKYINYFKFKGVSFSGGEPLLVYPRLIDYLRAIREQCNPDIYTWMYTNGILAETSKFDALYKLGINEVRFDIGATNYSTKYLQKAANRIPHLTVEIPAEPEAFDLLCKIVPELEAMGVAYLNLHQMRLTPYNAPKLLRKSYTMLHYEHPVVLESEIFALKLMEFIGNNGYKIGVNYCSSQYKYRFQKSGFRKILATGLGVDKSDLTENGYIRKIQPKGNNYNLNYYGFMVSNTGIEPVMPTNEDFSLVFSKGRACAPIELDQDLLEAYYSLIKANGAIVPSDDSLFPDFDKKNDTNL